MSGRQTSGKFLIATGGEEMSVHLDADVSVVPTSFGKGSGDKGHRVTVGDADVALRIAEQILGREPGGEAGTGDVHLPSDPERFLGVEGQGNDLVDVVGGGVVAGEVVHVAWIADEEGIEAGLLHAPFHRRDTVE